MGKELSGAEAIADIAEQARERIVADDAAVDEALEDFTSVLMRIASKKSVSDTRLELSRAELCRAQRELDASSNMVRFFLLLEDSPY